MSSNWQKSYKELQDFITANPSIKISINIVAIPEDVRPEFYRLFDTVRVAFLEERFQALLDEAKCLSESYTKVEQEVMELLELDSITTPPSLHRFLHDPPNELIRELFDLLFDLVKEKIDFETFEQYASKDIEAAFRVLYRSGYEKWVVLSLLKPLESDKTFNVTPPRPEEDAEGFQIRCEEAVPPPEESRNLSFKYEPISSLTVPDFIVHSAKLSQYVAIRTELGNAVSTAQNASDKREWYYPIRAEYGFKDLRKRNLTSIT